MPAGSSVDPRDSPAMSSRLTFISWANLVLAAVFVGLWLLKPASWWVLLMAVVFAAFGAGVLVWLRVRPPER